MKRDPRKGDADQRRSNIIKASRSRDEKCLPQLGAQFSTETIDNKRHLLRALGNIGGGAAETSLLEMLSSERGMILGDIAHALGKLRCARAAGQLKMFAGHRSEWVRQNVNFALSRITKHD